MYITTITTIDIFNNVPYDKITTIQNNVYAKNSFNSKDPKTL